MIRTAVKSDTPVVRDIWKKCFGDPDDFLDFYFGSRYDPSKTLIMERDGAIVSSLQCVPFDTVTRAGTVKSGYILGVITDPDHRKKGYASECIARSIEEQYGVGYALTTLIPQSEPLFGYYSKLGFMPFSTVGETVLTPVPGTDMDVIKISSANVGDYFDDLYTFYNVAYREADISVVKNRGDFLFSVNEFLSFEGDIYAAFDPNGNVSACGFLEALGENVYFKEFLSGNEASRSALVSSACREYNLSGVRVREMPRAGVGKTVPLSMARPVNALGVLALIARETPFAATFSITDVLIPENTGFYRIKDGAATRLPELLSPDFQIDISALILALTGKTINDSTGAPRQLVSPEPTVYMNLMLN